jgi:hypothetical protein
LAFSYSSWDGGSADWGCSLLPNQPIFVLLCSSSDRQSEVVFFIKPFEITPPEAMLRFFDLTAFLLVDFCRVSISPPFPEHCYLF